MKKIILTLFLLVFSCKEKDTLTEKKIFFSNLTEPKKNIYIELLYYYPAQDENQSNFYLVKDIHSNDTLYVVDKDRLPVSDFIKNYNGVENTAIVLKKGESKNKKEYLINIPSYYNLNNKNLYLGELIRIID